MRSTPFFMLTAAAAVWLGALGCGETSPSPTAPTTEPAVAAGTGGVPAFRQVAAGGNHSCGVTDEDLAYCWGFNSLGQLGDGTATDRVFPVRVLGGLRFRQVTVGLDHSCATTLNDRVYCWGRNDPRAAR